ncbi:MAG: GHMP kinase [Planctomycetaceae bacterium]|nr:GHMP kinase [Planctomycetaceae bacterium]MBP61025.1 GHMP kinase [Planctomycetaceae bacterium]
MQIIRHRSYARAGLIGNPSDGYHGKTISLMVRQFFAEVVMYEWDELEIVLTHQSQIRFNSIRGLVRDVQLHGYYGGIRLIKATIKKFVDYCDRHGHDLNRPNFSVRFQSNIPRQVGMAGSSAIIVATLRCLMEFYDLEIPLQIQPSLVREVETDELGLPAGLQDRVIQIYEGLVYMDFSKATSLNLDGYECGRYERLDASLLPPLYLAYNDLVSEPTEIPHNSLRAQYDQGNVAVHQAMDRFAQITDAAREAIENGDAITLAHLIDENFDLRQSIVPIAARQMEMVQAARTAGASAKFAGSGGAIIGTCTNETTWIKLQRAMQAIGCQIIRPQVLPESGHADAGQSFVQPPLD